MKVAFQCLCVVVQLRLPGAPDETLLRYAVEVQVPRDMRMLGMLEPMLERMAYEDIPVNLAALKQRVEDLRGSRQRQQRAADYEAQGEPALQNSMALQICLVCALYSIAIASAADYEAQGEHFEGRYGGKAGFCPRSQHA